MFHQAVPSAQEEKLKCDDSARKILKNEARRYKEAKAKVKKLAKKRCNAAFLYKVAENRVDRMRATLDAFRYERDRLKYEYEQIDADYEGAVMDAAENAHTYLVARHGRQGVPVAALSDSALEPCIDRIFSDGQLDEASNDQEEDSQSSP